MNAQHPFQTDRWAARTFRLWAERLDHVAQIAPRNNLIDLVEKLSMMRPFSKSFEAFVGECLLPHSAIP
jgi:hypothetical protein